MILYHGTTESRAKKIINDGKINRFAEKIYKGEHLDKETTDGYVYLTDKIKMALAYGANASIIMSTFPEAEKVYVFQVELPVDKIEIDRDEIDIRKTVDSEIESKVVDIESSLKYLYSVRYKGDLKLTTDVTAYFVVEGRGGVVFDAKNKGLNNDEIEKLTEWIDL